MKRISVSLRSFARKVILASVLMPFLSLRLVERFCWRNSVGKRQRVVQGKVVDGANGPVKGAVVYLKDDRSLTVKSYFSDAAGGYRFGQLSQNSDYEIWAESNGKKSAVKTISSFDNKNQFYINLKIDK